MSNRFKDGFTGETTTATMPVTTPEREEAAARKVAAGRALRAERRAKGELAPLAVDPADTVDLADLANNRPEPIETEAPQGRESDENAEQGLGDVATPDDGMTAAEQAQLEAARALEAERADLEQRAEAVNLGAQKNYGAGTSLKMLRRYVADAESEARSEQAADDAPPPPSDVEYDEADRRHGEASGRLHILQAELAGIQAGIDDAVASGDFGNVATLRARQSELPWLIEVAALDEARLDVPLSELRMARTRFQKKEARVAASKQLAALEKLKTEIWAIQNGGAAADSEHADAVIAHGAAMDRVRQLEAAMKQPASSGWRETGLQGLS